MAQYLIIGNGIAANSAAESIRKTDAQGKIIMFSRENYNFYYIPGLPEYLAGEKELRNITIHNDQWYLDNKHTIQKGTGVTHRIAWKQGILSLFKKLL